MYGLLCSHFAGVTRERFAADLAEKSWALLLEDEEGLRGFSTLLLYESTPPGEEVCTVVYSGDTIVDLAAWGSAALPRCWIAAVRRLRELHPTGRLWWLLLTSGFRTYRFLPVFWRDFWPRHDAQIPPEVRIRLDWLAREKLGPLYLETAGVVRFAQSQRLAGDLAGAAGGPARGVLPGEESRVGGRRRAGLPDRDRGGESDGGGAADVAGSGVE
jgi:hypothetical protein